MAIHGYCCNKMIVLSEEGAGTDLRFNCGEFMKTAAASERLSVCQQLFNADRLCVEIAPYCEPFKDDMLKERARARDRRWQRSSIRARAQQWHVERAAASHAVPTPHPSGRVRRAHAGKPQGRVSGPVRPRAGNEQ